MDPELMEHFVALEQMEDAKGCKLWDKPMSIPASPTLTTQVGGDHYKKLTIEPLVYILANKLGFVEGSVVKYVSRWKSKGGIQDLEKAVHMLSAFIEELKAADSGKVVVKRG